MTVAERVRVVKVEEIVALAKDAARYRWLRDGHRSSNRLPHIEQYPHQEIDKVEHPHFFDVGLDAAIDAAIEWEK